MPSFILIHPTVWPQYINVTDRQTGQDRRGQDRQTTVRQHRANRFTNGRPKITQVTLVVAGGLDPWISLASSTPLGTQFQYVTVSYWLLLKTIASGREVYSRTHQCACGDPMILLGICRSCLLIAGLREESA